MNHAAHKGEGEHAFSAEDLEQRKRLANRLAWLLGGVALLIYSIALSLPR
jgi:hypothetical protein